MQKDGIAELISLCKRNVFISFFLFYLLGLTIKT